MFERQTSYLGVVFRLIFFFGIRKISSNLYPPAATLVGVATPGTGFVFLTCWDLLHRMQLESNLFNAREKSQISNSCVRAAQSYQGRNRNFIGLLKSGVRGVGKHFKFPVQAGAGTNQNNIHKQTPAPAAQIASFSNATLITR